MNDRNKYIFTSDRLGFRNWDLADIDQMHEINSDEKVMEFFPFIPTKVQTGEFVDRMKNQFENNEFIGFIGLSEQTYEADFTPCIDIGWRIKK